MLKEEKPYISKYPNPDLEKDYDFYTKPNKQTGRPEVWIYINNKYAFDTPDYHSFECSADNMEQADEWTEYYKKNRKVSPRNYLFEPIIPFIAETIYSEYDASRYEIWRTNETPVYRIKHFVNCVHYKTYSSYSKEECEKLIESKELDKAHNRRLEKNKINGPDPLIRACEEKYYKDLRHWINYGGGYQPTPPASVRNRQLDQAMDRMDFWEKVTFKGF